MHFGKLAPPIFTLEGQGQGETLLRNNNSSLNDEQLIDNSFRSLQKFIWTVDTHGLIHDNMFTLKWSQEEGIAEKRYHREILYTLDEILQLITVELLTYFLSDIVNKKRVLHIIILVKVAVV